MSEQNPIYNDGKRITIGQNEFVVREIRATMAFRYLNKVFRIFRTIKERNPNIDWEILETSQLTAALIGSIDDVAEVLGDSMLGVVAESCRIDESQKTRIGDLPVSEFVELFAEVVMAQTPAVRAFLSQRVRLQEWRATLTSA